MVNILSLNNAQRSWHNATLQCQTVSSPLLHPSTRVLRIRMEVPPESTRIINKDVKLLGGVPVNLTCVSKGSHPAAMISWYRDNRLYAPQAIFDYADDIHTVTTITIIPSAHDNGAIMKCSALNSILGQNLDDSFQMTVAHKPVLQLALGSSLNPDDIKEGDDVYFDCGVKSNPRENRVSWFHDGKTVHMNQSFGIIINQRSLVLQKVRRTAIGLYTCRVANDLGVTTSEPVYLRVKHEPMCTEVDPVKVGAQKNETFVVRCRVTADPPAYKFKWTIQSSDEETLLTRLPEAPRNCTFNVTKVPQPRLTVKCFAGKSNYMPQHFTIEAFGRERRLLFNDSKIYNVTNRVKDTEVSLVVDWSILGTLTRDEVLGVVARNSMGPSEPTFLYNLSYDDIVPEPGPTPSLFSSLEIVMMAVATVILLLIAISLPSLYKQRAPAAAEIVAMNEIDGDENDDNPDIPEGGPENDDHLEIPEGSHQNGPVEVNNITFPRTKSNGSRIFDMNEIDLASRNDITPPSPAPPDPPNALILNESIRIFHLPERKNIYENILADKIDETIV